MTRHELIEVGQRLLVLAAMQIEDVAAELVTTLKIPSDLQSRAERLGELASETQALAAAATVVGKFAAQSSE